MNNFDQMLEIGEDGEKAVAQSLIENGWQIIAYYLYDVKLSPRMYANNKEIILPDIEAYHPKHSPLLIECKLKSEWLTRIGEHKTGIEARLLHDYRMLSIIKNIPVHIYFLQTCQDGIGESGVFFVDASEHHQEMQIFDKKQNKNINMALWCKSQLQKHELSESILNKLKGK